MKYYDLKIKFNHSGYTTIQSNLEIKKYIGMEIEIDAKVHDIKSNKIELDDGSTGYERGWFADPYTRIEFDNVKFENKMLLINKGTHVKIIAILKNIKYYPATSNLTEYYFDLKSIERI